MVRRASAGRSRAARRPPTAPARTPPDHRERDGGEDQAEAERGAELDDVVEPGVLTAPWPKGPEAEAGARFEAEATVALRSIPMASIAKAPAIPRSTPRAPPSRPCSSDSPVTCRTTRLCDQPTAFSVPSSRMRFATEESVSRRGDQDGCQEADQLERGSELLGQVLGVDQRAGDALGEILRGRHGGAAEARADRASRRSRPCSPR